MTQDCVPPDSPLPGPPEEPLVSGTPAPDEARVGRTGCLEVSLPGRPARAIPVVVGQGVWARLPALLPPDHHGVALVSEERVFGLHGEAVRALLAPLGHRVDVYRFPPGDAHKTRATKARLEDQLLAHRWGRDLVILALGGGVVTDLAGFLAATYLRGVRFLSLPTTLLAMVDAALGGKTGVNTGAGKNLVGAFHHPEAVLADIDSLGTLPPEELRNGLAETVKHALVGDAALFEWLLALAPAIRAAAPQVLTELVVRSAAVKLRVVAEDEREGGLRQILNFGHTLGHGVEKASGYRVTHGQAVSVGMCVEADAAVLDGLLAPRVRDRLDEALLAFGLPRRLRECIPEGDPGGVAEGVAESVAEGVPVEGILEALGVDKKARRGEVRFALPAEVGAAARFGGCYTTPLSEEALRRALAGRA